MTKNIRIAFIILIALGLVSCLEQGGLKAGTATGKSMLKLIPASARVVMMIDVHRALATDSVQSALKNERAKKKYDEFVKEAGLDPMKDVYFVALALSGTPGAKSQEGAVIVNLKYTRADLLAKLKEKAKDLREETYGGLTVYKGPAGKGADEMLPAAAFLDDSNIVLGNDKTVREVIDVYQKKAPAVDKNPEMKKYIKAVNTAAVVWGAVSVPQDLIKAQAEKNPMLKDLVGMTGLTMSFDYANRTLTVEVQGLGGTKEQNKSLADKLGALKGMGALAGGQEAVIADLMNAIEISSGPESVKIYASISAELLDKAQKLAQEKLGGMIQFNRESPNEPKKEEKKEEIKK